MADEKLPFWKAPSYTVRSGVNTSEVNEDVQGLINSLIKKGGMNSFDVISGYRDPSRNAAVGGAKGSQHLEGKAIDISTKGWTDEQRANFLKAAIESGAKGIGIYPNGSFHFDTRETPAAWGVGGSYRSSPIDTFPAWAQPHLTTLLSGKGGAVTSKVANKEPDADALASEFYTKPSDKAPIVGNQQSNKPIEIDANELGSEFYTKPSALKADPKATREANGKDILVPTKEGELNATNAARAVARGVPIIGGALNKLNAATNALIAPVGNQFFSPEDQLKGETFAERYENSLRQQEGMDKAFKEQNPKTNTALEVAGAIGGTLPVAATAAGGRLLGVTGPTLGARALQGAKSGAAIGAIDNYIRTGNADEAARAGLTGAVLGGATPYVAAGAGALARKGLELASPITTRTINKLGEALQFSESNIAKLKDALKSNPRLSAADVDENIKGLAQGLAAQPGEAQAVIRKAVSERAGDAKEAVKGVFNESLGQTPNVPILLDTLKKTTADNANKAFTNALSNAKPIDLKGLTQNEVSKVREVFEKVVSDLPDPGKLSQAELLHRVQSRLREEGQSLLKSSVGSERTIGKDLMNTRAKIVDKLNSATGGKFKSAQAQYADDMAIQDAFDKGTNLFKGGSALENRPDFFRQEFAKATKAEKDAIRLGARTAVDNLIGQSKRASTGANIAESEFNLDKLKIVLGEKEANRLAKLLKDEIDIAKVNTALLGGSQTEIRRGLAQSVAPRDIEPVSRGTGLMSLLAGMGGMQAFGVPGLAAAAVPIIGGAVRQGSQRVGKAIDVASNKDLAKLITSSGADAQKALEFIAERAAAQNRLGEAVRTGVTAVGKGSIPEASNQVERSPLMITVRKRFNGGGSN